ncbi:MAG TPA: hypothetical protein VG323_08075 [Thermoanaerobaculia bacterium]|nr:hypothetical protein [Thermoanaerobaculia bacterium]
MNDSGGIRIRRTLRRDGGPPPLDGDGPRSSDSSGSCDRIRLARHDGDATGRNCGAGLHRLDGDTLRVGRKDDHKTILRQLRLADLVGREDGAAQRDAMKELSVDRYLLEPKARRAVLKLDRFAVESCRGIDMKDGEKTDGE